MVIKYYRNVTFLQKMFKLKKNLKKKLSDLTFVLVWLFNASITVHQVALQD